MNLRQLHARAAFSVTLSFLSSATFAQVCSPQWLRGEAHPGVRGGVNCLLEWDPDGAGPRSATRIMGGSFTLVDEKPIRGIAIWNNSTDEWDALGSQINGTVYCAATGPGGTLVIGGSFSAAGNIAVSNIAAWDGSAWRPLRGGTNGTVLSLARLENGDLAAGGEFRTVDSLAIRFLARWDGAAWRALGAGVDGTVSALRLLPGGGLIAAGNFSTIGGVGANRIARLTGESWAGLGDGLDAAAYCLLDTHDGGFVVGGRFSRAGNITSRRVARWDGAQWSAMDLASDVNSYIASLCELPGGDIVGTGDIRDSVTAPNRIVSRWNGSAWTALASQEDGTGSALLPTGPDRFLCGGAFYSVDDHPAHNLVEFRENAWISHEEGLFDGEVRALMRLPDGRLMAGGAFNTVGTSVSHGIAIWDGTRWAPGGFSDANPVLSFVGGPDGTVYAGAREVTRWDGSSWTEMSNLSRPIYAMTILPGGDLLVGTTSAVSQPPFYSLFRWNGTNWQSVVGPDRDVFSLLVSRSGELFAGGYFSEAGGVRALNIARWDGVAWHPLGAGLNGRVFALAELPNGDVVAGGAFSQSGNIALLRVASWDGSTWRTLGSGISGNVVNSLFVLPDGQLLAGGSFVSAGPTACASIAKWDGTTWHSLGAGVQSQNNNVPNVYAIAVTQGEIVGGGNFVSAGGLPSYGFARWSETGIPWVAKSPEAMMAEVGETVRLSAVPASAYEGVSVRWLRDGAPVADGPGGSSAGGGVVSGATTILESPTDGGAATLTIAGARASDSGEYAAVVLNECGETVSTAATVRVFCRADFDRDGFVCAFDYDAFVACFEGATCPPGRNADFDRDGFVDGFDYDAFVAAFQDGCS